LQEAARPYRTVDTELAARLHSEVAAMNLDNFLVRPKRLYVERYGERQAWDNLAGDQAQEIAQ
jgi:type I restriction enzyme R subunit